MGASILLVRFRCFWRFISWGVVIVKTWADSRILYVVLQGEFALYREKSKDDNLCDQLKILIPKVKGHEYLVREWPMRSHKLQPDTHYVLNNVVGDRKSAGCHSGRCIPEQNLDLILNVGKGTPQPDQAHITISAPVPLAIEAGLRVSSPNAKVTVSSGGGKPVPLAMCAMPSAITILVYKWYESIPPTLTNNNGDEVKPSGPSANFQSFNLYATSRSKKEEDKAAHKEDAFVKAAALLGVTASIKLNSPNEPKKFYANPLPGLSWAQVNLFLNQIDGKSLDQLISDDAAALALDFIEHGSCGPMTRIE